MRADRNEVEDLYQGEPEKARAQAIKLFRFQWALNITSMVLSAVAVALYFADQRGLAQITLLLIAVVVFASVCLAYVRYKRNKVRRDALLAKLDSERSDRLREVFDEARREKNMPLDKDSSDGFDASLKDIERRAAEERARQAGRPPKKKGN
jgi:cbb3-type cytochrome oxidase subunit 3